jgi:hypothetical protein
MIHSTTDIMTIRPQSDREKDIEPRSYERLNQDAIVHSTKAMLHSG